MKNNFKMTFSYQDKIIFEKEFSAVELARILNGKGEVTRRKVKLPVMSSRQVSAYLNPDKRVMGSLNTDGYRRVWEFYCQGYSAKQISTIFRNEVSHDTVSKAVRRIKAIS